MNEKTLQRLNEAISPSFQQKLIESSNERYKPLTDVQKADLKILMENVETQIRNNDMNESTMTPDVAQYTTILLPMIRDMYPNLIAHELLGIQPMTMPTGYIYAWANKYTGSTTHGVAPSGKAVIVKLDKETDANVGDTVNTDGKLLHKEGLYALITVGSTEVKVETTTIGNNTAKVKEIYTNRAAFDVILKNYTGPHATAKGEVLSKDMMEVGFEVVKKSIEVQTRKIKTPYTMEMYQDLKAQHGQLADDELMRMASFEINKEIDIECVNAVNSWALQVSDTKFNVATGDKWGELPGRWELEKYRAEVIRLEKEAELVGQRSMRGRANIILCSPRVAIMLRQVGNFALAPVSNDLQMQAGGGFAGVFDNRYRVIVDRHAKSDYITTLYKGIDRHDSIGFYCPYVPITFTRTTDPHSAQPSIVATTRYALTATPGVTDGKALDRANTYATSYGVDFSNTLLK